MLRTRDGLADASTRADAASPGGLLVLRAWIELLYVDVVGVFGFRGIKWSVARMPITAVPTQRHMVLAAREAVLSASSLYFRRIRCLQHSAVLTRLLRRRGVPAQVIIGYHMPPLKAHAWVELEGEIIAEYKRGLEHYAVLDRW